ncbi:dTDP-4-dehydrorhamnose 3,5-epimerase [Salinibacter ruber]|uniref:dTDP-4-dehydrorhamnose 3,5-epimerase n=1 Tax=Salinibacter ruber TaxID=146919 RepID=UPI002167E2FD|nr:dTDP-4-dehydrorhamnose 3,5-epimerase [Salinibacter ruber]MCS4142431.1 dTDP-4-dehydrorhamnose 3,5-epimerase [Salinibacter ruber]
MEAFETDLPGVYVIEPDVYADHRGDFREIWNAREYAEHGVTATFVQDNLSRSKPRVLRGLHFQNPRPQGKLVSVFRGEVYDVALDVRVDSDTFGQWEGWTLSAENGRQLYVPEGFAHGFVVTSRTEALFHYKCTDFYAPDAEETVRWDDPDLSIDWPVDEPILSEKDRAAPGLHELEREQVMFTSIPRC